MIYLLIKVCVNKGIIHIKYIFRTCKRCRAEASMKTENRKERKRRFNGSLELRTVRDRDKERERERKHRKKLYYKTLTQYSVHMCVFNAHVLYKSLQGLTEERLD